MLKSLFPRGRSQASSCGTRSRELGASARGRQAPRSDQSVSPARPARPGVAPPHVQLLTPLRFLAAPANRPRMFMAIDPRTIPKVPNCLTVRAVGAQQSIRERRPFAAVRIPEWFGLSTGRIVIRRV